MVYDTSEYFSEYIIVAGLLPKSIAAQFKTILKYYTETRPLQNIVPAPIAAHYAKAAFAGTRVQLITQLAVVDENADAIEPGPALRELHQNVRLGSKQRKPRRADSHA